MNLHKRTFDNGHEWLADARSRALSDPSASIVFSHTGVVCHDAVQRLVEEAESASLRAEEPMVPRKRLINVLVEGLENLHHHTLPARSDVAYALLARDRGGYLLALGNAVPLATASLLMHRVAILNEMDDTDLKEHYLRLLANDARSKHGGAGLGLLTMARKSERPIRTSTAQLCPGSALFRMELRIACL